MQPAPDFLAYLDQYGVSDDVRKIFASPVYAFINGTFVKPSGDIEHHIIEPATGSFVASCKDCSAADIDHAVTAAHAAMAGSWGALKPNERQNLLLRLADLVERDARTLATIETINTGKALEPCLAMDVLGSVDLLRYMAGWATKIEGGTRQVSAPGSHFALTCKEPIGVVAAIVPWNWPLNMATWKIAAPLAAGCAVVLKPDVKTPYSTLYLAKLAQEAGFPPGTINILLGDGATVGAALVAHPGIAKVSFTGSTDTGRKVGALAATGLKSATLELGGKSPMIAFKDADIDAIASAVRWSIFFNAGQVCSGGSRLLVEKSIYDPVIAALVAMAEAMTLAPGLDPACDMGPMISSAQQTHVLGFIERARTAGLNIITGGSAGLQSGFFVKPTIICTQDTQVEVWRDEIFGPILTVMTFEDEEEALRLANDTPYGLGASIWTQNISRAIRLGQAVKAGSVWINTHDLVDSAIPFGGFANSGHGKDMGREQLESYLNTKSLWIAL